MTVATFGNVEHIRQFTNNPDHVYTFEELCLLSGCPGGLVTAWDAAIARLDEADETENQDLLIWASEDVMRAEHDLKQWGEKQGYRVTDDYTIPEDA